MNEIEKFLREVEGAVIWINEYFMYFNGDKFYVRTLNRLIFCSESFDEAFAKLKEVLKWE